jgi:hypothetical protein
MESFDSLDRRNPIEPEVGMRVDYKDGEIGKVTYISETLVVVRWDKPRWDTTYGCRIIWEEAVPRNYNFYKP